MTPAHHPLRRQYLTAAEAAQVVGCSQWLIRRAIREKRLVATRIYSAVRIDRCDLDAFLLASRGSSKTGPAPAP